MAHFAKLDENNIVTAVHVVNNEVAPDEATGIEFLNNLHGEDGVWKQTSYNTFGGQHNLGGTPLRKNYAGIGYIYDEDRDAFIEPKPFPSYLLNEEKCQWEPPIPYPNDGEQYVWNEESYQEDNTTGWDKQ